MSLNFKTVQGALTQINEVPEGSKIHVAESNLNDEAKNSILELIEKASLRKIRIVFEGEALQKSTRIQVFVVTLFVFCLCFAPTFLSPLVNADGMSLLVVQGIWILGLAKANLLNRLGIRPGTKEQKPAATA